MPSAVSKGRLIPAAILAILVYGMIAAMLGTILPELSKRLGLTPEQNGTIAFTYDEVPHLGHLPNGVHYALGYCGTGVSRATYFGNKIALKVLSAPDARTAFDDLAFPAFPAHPIAKRAVPIVETWYRLRDKTGL